MFKSVFTRFFWNNLIIILISLVVLSASFFLLINRYINDTQYEENLKAARNIEKMTETLIIKNPDYRNYIIYNNMLDQYSRMVESDITVINSKGEVYSSTNNVRNVPKNYNDKVLSGKTLKIISDFGGIYDKRVLVIGIPMTYLQNTVGGIYFNTKIPDLRGRLNDFVLMFLLACIFSIVVACLISYIQSKRITNPIKEINKGVMDIASGNFKKRLVSTPDEIGQLASSFNFMADSLERLEKMRTSFISDVSHELRTPMTSISGFVGGILDGTVPKEKEKEYLQIVYDESKRLTKLTNDMLEMTKMQSSEYKLDVTSFDINELIRICIIQMENKIDEKNLEIDVDFCEDKLYVLADKDAIKRVILNILDNAVKFSYPNTKIILKCEIANKKANISIGNFGSGIKESEIKNIFDRFYKTDKSRSEDKKGAGLGMSLAKNILNLHKQNIWVECYDAKEGTDAKFTKFTFTLALSE